MGFNRDRNILTLCGTDFFTKIRKTRPWPWIPTPCLAFPAPQVRARSKKPIATRQRPCTRTCIPMTRRRWKSSSACHKPGTSLATRKRRASSIAARLMAMETRWALLAEGQAAFRVEAAAIAGNREAAVHLKVRRAIRSKISWAACSGVAGAGAVRGRKRDAIYATGWKFRSRMPLRARAGA